MFNKLSQKIFLIACMAFSFSFISGIKISSPKLISATLQSDDKSIMVGSVMYPEKPHVFVVRYNTDGTLDTSFANKGFLVQVIGTESVAKSVIVQPDGKIIVAGYCVESYVMKFLAIRYNSDGTKDTTFAADNSGITKVAIDSAAAANDVVLQSDSAIVLGGFSVASGVKNFALARLTSAGVLDATYGTSGVVTTLIGISSEARSIAVQSDNKIVAAGTASILGYNQFALARYTTGGLLDTGFNTTGTVITDINNSDEINSVAIQSTGEIVVGGVSAQDFVLARYTTAGSLDTTFNGTGIVSTDLPKFSQINGITLDSSGKIIVAGVSYDNLLTGARYTTAGVLDSTFGSGGLVIFFDVFATGIIPAVQSDGKIIGFGSTPTGFIVGRFLTNGMIDIAYGSNGVIEEITPPDSFVSYISEHQSTGTNGGTFTGSAWQTRVLNSFNGDPFNTVLSSNQFTLPVGRYYLSASAPAFGVGNHQIRLQNITLGKTEVYGSNAYSGGTVVGADNILPMLTRSTLYHSFIVPVDCVFEIQHYAEQTRNTDGFGMAMSFAGNDEVYTQVQVMRLS